MAKKQTPKKEEVVTRKNKNKIKNKNRNEYNERRE